MVCRGLEVWEFGCWGEAGHFRVWEFGCWGEAGHFRVWEFGSLDVGGKLGILRFGGLGVGKLGILRFEKENCGDRHCVSVRCRGRDVWFFS